MAAKKLMIIDDEQGFTQLVSEYFKSAGYQVHAAHTLEEAVTIFRDIQPKVVLLDFNMPLITGEKFLPILQSMNPLVRAIVVTGCLGEDVEEKFKGLGYFAYFEKGNLSLEKVKEKVEEAISY